MAGGAFRTSALTCKNSMRRKNGSSSYDTKATFKAISTNAIEVISNKTTFEATKAIGTFEATKAIATFEATKAIEDINTKTALVQRIRPTGHCLFA